MTLFDCQILVVVIKPVFVNIEIENVIVRNVFRYIVESEVSVFTNMIVENVKIIYNKILRIKRKECLTTTPNNISL